jgi:hypothetical protein
VTPSIEERGDLVATIVGRTLLGATMLAPFLLFCVHIDRPWIGLLPQILVLVFLYSTNRRLFSRALFWPLFYAALISLPWPLTFVAPLLAYWVIYRLYPSVRIGDDTFATGRFTRPATWWTGSIIVLSGCALLAWFLIFKPDLSDLKRSLPPFGPPLLLAVGICLSIFNALWEEAIVKGIAWAALEELLPRDFLVNLGQAILFGMMHVGGFPRGLTGVCMAALYAFALGIVKKLSGGLLAPIVAHAAADMVIVLIVVLLVPSA